ncbi:MAG: hypothetical protein V1886_02180 [archaeon]
MDVLGYMTCRAHMLYVNMINELPQGSVQSGMFYAHPFFVLGAWTAKKIGLEKLSEKMIQSVIGSAKDGINGIKSNIEKML